MFASLPSPISSYTVSSKQVSQAFFSNRVRYFLLQFQVRLHMMHVILVETSGKISL